MTLFTPFKLGQIELKNRIVMASMTRGRTTGPGHVPNELQVEYYRQRASAGLILAEGTWVSREAIGFISVADLFTSEQAEGWRKVTDAIHQDDRAIFAQLAHSRPSLTRISLTDCHRWLRRQSIRVHVLSRRRGSRRR